MFSKVKILVIMNINKFKEAIMVRNINDEISRIKDEEKSLYELNICFAEFEKRKKVRYYTKSISSFGFSFTDIFN